MDLQDRGQIYINSVSLLTLFIIIYYLFISVGKVSILFATKSNWSPIRQLATSLLIRKYGAEIPRPPCVYSTNFYIIIYILVL
jgi:hypothetical protein